jgi:hypothetical protein|tara:strand:- start:445 stop:654 length:210 start_codon:yes stop_codon:yes gene_type:complete
MGHIHYPSQTTYWIIFNDNQTVVKGYGVTEPNQFTDSVFTFTTYLDETEWKTILEQHGIDPDPDPEPPE